MIKNTEVNSFDKNNSKKLEDLLNEHNGIVSLKDKIIYAENNKILYILIQTLSKNPKELNNSLLVYSLEIYKTLFKIEIKEQLDIKTKLFLDDSESCLCLFESQKIGFINNLDKINENSKISFKHIVNDNSSKKLKQTEQENFSKFKFSHYKNYFGLLLENRIFKFYHIDSSLAIASVNLTNLESVTDFCFGPILSFGWQNFVVFFLDKSGDIHYSSSLIFPEEFHPKRKHAINMSSFYNNIEFIDDKDKEEYMYCKNLLIHLYGDLDKLNEDKLINVDQYLLQMNKKEAGTKRLKIIEKRSYSDQDIRFDQLLCLKTTPLSFIRSSSNKSFLDVLVLNDNFISFENSKNSGLLLERILFTNSTKKESLKLELNSNNNSLLVNQKLDLTEITFPYLSEMTKKYEKYSQSELNANFRANISNILSFSYLDNKSNWNNVDSYDYIIDLESSKGVLYLILKASKDNKFLVKEIPKLEYKQSNSLSSQTSKKLFNTNQDTTFKDYSANAENINLIFK